MFSIMKKSGSPVKGWRIAAGPGLLLLLLDRQRGWCGHQTG